MWQDQPDGISSQTITSTPFPRLSKGKGQLTFCQLNSYPRAQTDSYGYPSISGGTGTPLHRQSAETIMIIIIISDHFIALLGLDYRRRVCTIGDMFALSEAYSHTHLFLRFCSKSRRLQKFPIPIIGVPQSDHNFRSIRATTTHCIHAPIVYCMCVHMAPL